MILYGDCLEILKGSPDCQIDAIITDPPYGLKFMGKKWDYDVPSIEIWKECLRVLKPGGHVLSFCGTRTYHRMVTNMEDAGFEIRDQIQWIYGSGFPKSHNGDWGGTALKPANEPICLARKPLIGTVANNFEKYGTGGLNIDASRIGFQSESDKNSAKPQGRNTSKLPIDGYAKSAGVESERHSFEFIDNSQGRWPANVIFDEFQEHVLCLKGTVDAGIKIAIEVFYASYGPLQNLQKENDNLSESEGSKEVLLEDLLLRGHEGSTWTDDGQASLKEVTVENGKDQESPRDSHSRQESSDLQGHLVFEGLSACKHHLSSEGSEKNTDSDVSEESRQLAGASTINGTEVGSTVNKIGSSSSQKRDQGRQSNSKSGTKRHKSAQERPLASVERGEKASCLVRESDVPQVWLQYFERSGFTVRAGAASMLDEQVKETMPGMHSAGSARKAERDLSTEKKGMFPANGKGGHRLGDSGGASRFFYCAKASKSERNRGLEGMPEKIGAKQFNENMEGKVRSNGTVIKEAIKQANHHPTVKPIKLMEYLCKLITPTNGIILDPFCGSGSTGVAAKNLGFEFIGIEREAEYCEIANKRIKQGVS